MPWSTNSNNIVRLCSKRINTSRKWLLSWRRRIKRWLIWWTLRSMIRLKLIKRKLLVNCLKKLIEISLQWCNKELQHTREGFRIWIQIKDSKQCLRLNKLVRMHWTCTTCICRSSWINKRFRSLLWEIMI